MGPPCVDKAVLAQRGAGGWCVGRSVLRAEGARGTWSVSLMMAMAILWWFASTVSYMSFMADRYASRACTSPSECPSFSKLLNVVIAWLWRGEGGRVRTAGGWFAAESLGHRAGVRCTGAAASTRQHVARSYQGPRARAPTVARPMTQLHRRLLSRPCNCVEGGLPFGLTPNVWISHVVEPLLSFRRDKPCPDRAKKTDVNNYRPPPPCNLPPFVRPPWGGGEAVMK